MDELMKYNEKQALPIWGDVRGKNPYKTGLNPG